MEKRKKVLFYYLSAFSNTGGIEKFNRSFIKALVDLGESEPIVASIVSAYDTDADERYIRKGVLIGFGKRRICSVVRVIRDSFRNDILILGHINLAIAGIVVKMLRPKTKLLIIAHGIEIWHRMFFVKKWALRQADLILSVSNYTRNQLVLKNNIDPKKIQLFPNTIDPYFSSPATFEKHAYLLERYGLSKAQPVIFTLSRLVSSEKYKGYDIVLASMPFVLQEFPNAVYILAGKYDVIERERIQSLITEYDLAGNVILTGFLEEKEVTDHYCLADVFIMPSRKEGFGIVFLEALACGTMVIGGNQDGTVDALKNGSLGRLINPAKQHEIASAIIEILKSGKRNESYLLQRKVLGEYRFEKFKTRLSFNLTGL